MLSSDGQLVVYLHSSGVNDARLFILVLIQEVMMPSRVVCVHRGKLGDTGLWYYTYNGVWSGDTRLSNGAKSSEAPSLAVVNNQLHCVHRGDNNDDRLWWCTFDPYLLSWSEDVPFKAGQCSSAAPPAVANY